MSQYYLFCHNNDQTNGSRVLSQQSNLCRDIKSCRVKDLCCNKGKLCQDKVCCDKDSNVTTNSSISDKDQGMKYVAA